MFRIRKRAIAILGLFALLAAARLTAAVAAEPRTVRVGYFAFPGYHELIPGEKGPRAAGTASIFCRCSAGIPVSISSM